MSRYSISFKSQSEGKDLESKVLQYFEERKFKRNNYKEEENVLKLGSGFWTAPKYVKYSIEGNEVTIEAWIKAFLIFGESNLKGFVGGLPKKQLKKIVTELEVFLA